MTWDEADRIRSTTHRAAQAMDHGLKRIKVLEEEVALLKAENAELQAKLRWPDLVRYIDSL